MKNEDFYITNDLTIDLYIIVVFDKEEKKIICLEKDDEESSTYIYHQTNITSIEGLIKINSEKEKCFVTYSNYDFIKINGKINILNKTLYYFKEEEEITFEHGKTINLYSNKEKYKLKISDGLKDVKNVSLKIRIISHIQKPDFNITIQNKVISCNLNQIINEKIKFEQKESEIIFSPPGDYYIIFEVGLSNKQYILINDSLDIPMKSYNIFTCDKKYKSDYSIVTLIKDNIIDSTICAQEIYEKEGFYFPYKINNCFNNNNKSINYLFNCSDFSKNIKNEDKLLYIYIGNMSGITGRHYYYNLTETKNQENFTLFFNNNNYSNIISFNSPGDVYFLFEKNISNIDIYLFDNMREIKYNSKNNIFENYYYKFKKINNNKLYFNTNKIGIIYFIFHNKNDIIENNILKIFTEEEYEIDTENMINFELFTNDKTSQFFKFKFPKNKKKYCHCQWSINNQNIKGKLYLKGEDSQNINYYNQNSIYLSFEKEDSCIFEINNSQKIENITININFDFVDYNNYTFFRDDKFCFPILSNQDLFLIQSLPSNENETTFFIPQVNFNINLSYHFTEKVEIPNIEKIINDKKFENFSNKFNIKKIEDKTYYSLNTKNLSIILIRLSIHGIDYINYNNKFCVEKNITIQNINSDSKIHLIPYQKRKIQFNEIKENDIIIILTTNYSKAINVEPKTLNIYDNQNLYVLNKEMLSKQKISFTLYDEKNNYAVNITYHKNKNSFIKYAQKRNNLLTYRIYIDNCKKENYFFSLFNTKSESNLYIEKLYGDGKIYFKNLDNSNLKEEIFSNFTEYKNIQEIKDYNYDIFNITCTKNTLFYIKYYDKQYFKEKSISLNYNSETGFFVKDNLTMEINSDSEIIGKEFSCEFQTYFFKEGYKINITFNKENFALSGNYKNNNDVSRKKLKKLINKELNIANIYGNTFITIKIGNNIKADVYDSSVNGIIPNNNYISFPFLQKSVDYYIIKIQIIDFHSENNIFIYEGFSEDNFLYLPKINSLEFNKEQQNIEIKIYNPYNNETKKNSKEIFYTNLYIENPKNFKIYYKLNDSWLKTRYCVIVILIIVIIGFIIYIYRNYKKKKEIEINEQIVALKTINEYVFYVDQKQHNEW